MILGLSAPAVLVCIALYLLIVRLLRHRRRASIYKKHNIHGRSDFKYLTADAAQSILLDLVSLEFPRLMGLSIVFALFKAYGIPSVSRLLVSTGASEGIDAAAKRTADTGVLLLEFCLNAPSSERARQAIARMNALHRPYIRDKKVSQADMLYVLSLFALEPVRAVEKYEWRPLSDLERCASGTFWKAMGDNMEIDYTKVVPKFEGDFPDGLAWLEALEQWSLHYEETRSKPCTESSDLALKHLDAVFLNLPERLKIVGRWVVAITCGERLRKAIILPQPPHVFRVVVVNLLLLRKLYLGHLALPIFIRKTYISEKPESNGRYSAKDYLSYPYYVKPTFQRRWGKRAWVTWLLGRKIPGDDGNRYIPEGYAILEVGPALPSGEDMHWTNDEVRRLENSGAGACPFSFGS